MTDYEKALAAAREALTKLREYDGGTRYNAYSDPASPELGWQTRPGGTGLR